MPSKIIMDKLFKRKFMASALVYALCIPLFFINIRNSHDWGDDFAQYIHQAINITKGIPQSATGFIDDIRSPGVHISARPVGFPLILAMTCLYVGNSIKGFVITVTFILFLLCIALFSFYRKHFSDLVSILLVLIFAYNPFTLNFKEEIMSDIPFTLFLILVILVYSKTKGNKTLKYLLTGLLLGILISIRTIGIVLLAALILEDIISLWKNRRNNAIKLEIMKRALVITITIVFVLIDFKALFKIGIGSEYFASISFPILRMKASYYLHSFRYFFMSGGGVFPLLAILTQWLVVLFTTIGFLKKCFRKVDFIDFFVIIYLFALLLYPDMNSGMRFLFPVFPILIYYTVIGLMMVKINSPLKKNIIILSLGLFILIPYSFSAINIIRHQNETLPGPQEAEAVEAFEYIKRNTPMDAKIAFNKPRALNLYTDRRTILCANQSLESIAYNNLKYNVQYLLTCTDLPDDSTKKFLMIYPDKPLLLWSNSKFSLYQLNYLIHNKKHYANANILSK